MLANTVGFLASCISFILWMPQALLVWRARRNPIALSGVSVATQVFVLANAALWGLYAILTSSFWVGAPGLINAPLALLTLTLVAQAKRLSAPETALPSSDPVLAEESALP